MNCDDPVACGVGRCQCDDAMPRGDLTIRDINEIAEALHTIDDMTPGSPRVATWGTLSALLGDECPPDVANVPLNRRRPDGTWGRP